MVVGADRGLDLWNDGAHPGEIGVQIQMRVQLDARGWSHAEGLILHLHLEASLVVDVAG